jgi:hypothetical protein
MLARYRTHGGSLTILTISPHTDPFELTSMGAGDWSAKCH